MRTYFLLLAGLILLAFTACQNDELVMVEVATRPLYLSVCSCRVLMLLLPARRATVHR